MIKTRCRLVVVFYWCLASFTLVTAHEGHDHSAPSGLWPAHSPSDPNAGYEPPPAQAEVWLHSDGTTGSSPRPDWNENIENTLADVNTVAFDMNHVYIRTSGIPSHSIGRTGNDPNPAIPGDLDATYRVSLNPTPATTNRATSLANIAVAINGAAIYNWSDGSYWDPASNNLVMGGPGGGGAPEWNTNALWARANGFDDAGGHPSGGPGQPLNAATYHYHQDPYGLQAQIDPGNTGQTHSPIVGFAFDGYPIYGPYAYTNGVDDSEGLSQMTSSYQLINSRPADGPSETDYELGSFAEDFEYVAESGTLNEFNMRFSVTPEFPDGTWAYFTTYDLDGSGTPLDGDIAYPFTVGPEYFGEVDEAMLMPGAVITVPDDVEFYFQYVPEPASASLVLVALLSLFGARHRMRKSRE